jgi:hypothetical protein
MGKQRSGSCVTSVRRRGRLFSPTEHIQNSVSGSRIDGRKDKVYFLIDKIIYYDINKHKIVNVINSWMVNA